MNRSWNFRRGVLLALAGYTAFLVFAAPQRCADALQALETAATDAGVENLTVHAADRFETDRVSG